MEPWSREPVGRFDELEIESNVLRDNPLGDPHVRPLWVYVPPGYDDDVDRRYPSVYVLQGYTGMLPMWHNRSPFRPTFPEAADRLFATEGAPPCRECASAHGTAAAFADFRDTCSYPQSGFLAGLNLSNWKDRAAI